MTDKPIIFSGPMVRALLEGRKTQTRRVLNPQPEDLPNGLAGVRLRYAKGDRLYVREAFIGPYAYEVNGYPPRDWGNKAIWFPADGPVPEGSAKQFWHVARPSIHMPRWASRLTLTVTEVRVQRLQDISEADAMAEGVYATRVMSEGYHLSSPSFVAMFQGLWNNLHGPDAWDANPWIVALTFTVAHGNIDQIGRAA